MSSSSHSLTLVENVPLSTKMLLRRGIRRHAGKKSAKSFRGLSSVRLKLPSVLQQSTSSAGAANSVVSAFYMSSSYFPEVSGLMGLYDEMRVISGKVMFDPIVNVAGATTGIVRSYCTMGIGFDPSASSPPSIVYPLQNSYHAGPFSVPVTEQPAPYKLFALDWKSPPPLAPVTSSDVVGGSWFCLDTSTAPCVGVVEAYLTALGGTATTQFNYFIELDVEVRLRT